MNNQAIKSTGCCDPFDPTPWDDKEVKWENKRFIRDKVFTIFNIPMNFGRVMTRMMAKVKGSGRKSSDMVCLSDHTSKWNMDVYVSVDQEIPGAKNTTLSGKFLSKVYEGPFQDTGKWCKDFEGYVKGKDKKIKKMYMWYTTCPKCAKVYGKNYIVILAQID